MLEDEADPLPAKSGQGCLVAGHFRTVDENLAIGWLIESGRAVEKCTLSGARWSHHRCERRR